MTPTVSPPPAAPKKSNNRGCAIALVVAASLGVLSCIAMAGVMVAFGTSEDGKKIFSGVGKALDAVEKAQNAPGAAEVAAAGCPQAGVVDMNDMMDIVADFIDGGAPSDLGLMVFCQGGLLDTNLPDCSTIAKAYLSAPDRPVTEFMVEVRRQGNNRPLCHEEYDAAGTLVRRREK